LSENKEKNKMPNQTTDILETFPNPNTDRDFTIKIEIPEFSCLCPKTGQPDFAVLKINYIPDSLCVELKSLKLYVLSYRDHEAFHETVTNKILNDLVASASPRFMSLKANFNVRGGIYTSIVAEHVKEGWSPEHKSL
jgi:7-cyano-7-deazaguanine reductase